MIPRTIRIIEESGSGHRFGYVRIIAEAALARGDRAVLSITQATRERYDTEFGVHLGTLVDSGRLTVDTHASFGSRWLFIRRVGRDDGRASVICFPSGDSWLFAALASQPFSRRERQELRLLIMRPFGGGGRTARSFATNLAKRLAARTLKRTERVAVGGLIGVSARAESYIRAGYVPVADPVITPATPIDWSAARAHFGIGHGDRVVAILGGVSLRKNPSNVLEAVRRLSTELDDLVFFAPGKLDDGTLALFQSQRPSEVRIVYTNEYLSAASYAAALRVPDVVVAAYDNEGSSGVLTESSAVGAVVVGAGATSVREQAEALGGISTENSVAGLLDGIGEAMQLRESRKSNQESNGALIQYSDSSIDLSFEEFFTQVGESR